MNREERVRVLVAGDSGADSVFDIAKLITDL
jgi:hypothetical protein